MHRERRDRRAPRLVGEPLVLGQGLHSYGPYGHGLFSYGLYGYGLYSYGLHS